MRRRRGCADRARASWIRVPLARWLTFDPYYLPSLRRYSDGEIHEPRLVSLGAASLVAALLAWRAPRLGSALTAVFLLTALTAWLLPIGK